MLMPMGYLIGLGYANVIGDPNDIETLRNTVFSYFSEDSSIPDSGTPYHGYWGTQVPFRGSRDVAFKRQHS